MLKPVLLANAASCAVFGLIFMLFAIETSQLVGSPDVLTLQIVGAGLVANAGFLVAASLQRQPSRTSIMIFVSGDAAWVVATVFLILSGLWITTTVGIVLSLCVAAFVGLFGWLQSRNAPT